MVLPIFWLGGAAVSAILLADERTKRRDIELNRLLGKTAQKSKTNPLPSGYLSPSQWQNSHKAVAPKPGSIVCCFVYGIIEHTGIWLDDNTLIELHGSGLIRAVSTKRFLAGRTGSKIFIACSHDHQALFDDAALVRAEKAIFTYREYDLFDNNCHRFVWACLSSEETSLPSFNDLNKRLSGHFKQDIYWDEAILNRSDQL